MATKSFEELNTGALTIKNNELPESNTHTLVGNQLVDMVAKEQEIDGKVNSQVAQLRSELEQLAGDVNLKVSEEIIYAPLPIAAEDWAYGVGNGSGIIIWSDSRISRIATTKTYSVKKGDILRSLSDGVKVLPIIYDSTTGEFISEGVFEYEHIIEHDGAVRVYARLEPDAVILDISSVIQYIELINDRLTSVENATVSIKNETEHFEENITNGLSKRLNKYITGSGTDVFTKANLITGDFNFVKVRITSDSALNFTSPNGIKYGCLGIYVGNTEFKSLQGNGEIRNQNGQLIGTWDKTQPVDVTFYFITPATTISYADRIMSSSAFKIEISTAKVDLENLFSIAGLGVINTDSAGSVSYNEDYNYSDYIPVSIGDEILFTGTVYTNVGIAMYDAGKNYVGMLFNFNMYPDFYTLNNSPRYYYKDFYLVIPSGVAFIRACNSFQGNSTINTNAELYNLSAKRNLKQVVEISERVFNYKIADVDTGSSILSNDEVYLGAKKFLLWNPYKEMPASPIKIDGQLHTHTSQSDGGDPLYNSVLVEQTPEEVARVYSACNYKFWTITDHNRVTPKPANNDDLGLIWIGESYESTGADQHICVYMGELETYDSTGLPVRKGDQDLFGVVSLYGLNKSMNEIIEHYTTNGNLINYAHPFSSIALQTEEKVKSAIAGIGLTEVLNGTLRSDEAWDWQLQEGHKVFGIAVDDYHNNPGAKERYGWVEAWVTAETKQEVLKALFTGCFVAANGVVPSGGVEGDGMNGITITSLSFIDGVYSIQTDIPCTFKFINQTGISTPVKTVTSANSATYELSISDKYVRCEISADSGVTDEPWIKWTQPVFVIGEKLSYEIK